MGFIYPPTSGASADTATITAATSGTLTLSQTSYNSTYVYFTGTLNATITRTLILKLNSSTTSGDYTISALQECDNSGNVNLSFSSGLPCVFSGGPSSGTGASAAFDHVLILTYSGGTTTWILLGRYATNALGVGSIYGTGTFNAQVTTVGLSSNSTFSATISGIKVS